MKHTLTSKAAELMRKNGRHRRWRRAFSGMAAVVVFITTYMLILPAITMENQAICGMAEHTHTDACYEMQLVCTQEETPEGTDVHVHGPECYEQQQVLTCTKQEGEGHVHSDACYGYVCGQEESAGHTHTDACYTEVTHRELTCTEPESAGHTHGDGCYDADGNLVCTEAESTGHTHGDSCYTETVTRELTCGQEESAGHTHTDACIGLICGQEEYEGHTHTDACYTTEDVLVCTEPTGHTHGDGCYEKVLVCDVPEHTHTEECYPAAEPEEPQEPEFICTLPEHSHEDACYDADGNLICGMEEHTHTEECYAPVEIPEEETPTTAFPEEIPEGYVEYTFDNKAGLTVTAYAPEGAFGQDVQLFAEVLSEDSEEYAQAKENLDKAENAPEYTGMAAMDIRFVDAAAEDPAAAEEIEPDAEMGQVFVKIDAQALIPEDVDESTLAMQHHAKVSDGGIFGTGIFEHTDVVVETVADNTEETGDITAVPDETALPETLPALADEPEMAEAATLEEPAAENETEETQPAAMNVEAEFAVNSFSKFTITWNNNSLTVYYVNTDGTQIRGTQTLPVEVTENSWITLADYAGEISGYTYQGAKVDNMRGSSATHVQYFQRNNWWEKSSGWYYRNGPSGDGNRINGAIYLVYQKISTGTPIDNTVDTESKGIHINLFDYNGNTNLEYNNGYINEGVNIGHELKFSGGQGTEGSFNKWTGNRSPFSGIVSSSLGADGYPYLNYTTTWANDSLGYLFGAGGNNNVTAHTNLNKLFIQDVDGYYVYNAAQNFATLKDSEGYTNSTTATNGLDFTVYDIQSQVVNVESAEQNVLFLPFNEIDDEVDSINYHFGMTIDFKFIMPEDGQINGKDMVFEFEGDDDVWVFIDGKLALDLGGIHDAASGSINFNTGVITVNGVAQNQTLWELLGEDKFSNYSEHSFNFYYLERGKGASNCYIKFNLPAIPTGSISVSKDLNATSDYQQEHSTDKYRMQLIVDGQAKANTPYVDLNGDPLGTTNANGCFDLADGQTAIFNTIPVNTQNYYVKELGVVRDNELIPLEDANFTNVSFNEAGAEVTPDGAVSDQYTFDASSTNNVVVRNTPVEGGEDQSFLRVEKNFSLPGLDMTQEDFTALVKASDYTIKLYNGSDASGTLIRTLLAKNAVVSWDNTSDTGTLVWNVYTSASGNFYMTEENYESLFQSLGYAWTEEDGFNEVVSVDPPSIEISNNNRVETCKANFYNVGDINFVVAALTSGEGYLVYTDVPISQGERQSIVDWAKKQPGPFGNITMTNSDFYSHQTNPNGFTFRGSVIQYPCDADLVRQMMQENPDLTVYDKNNHNQVVDNGTYLYFSLPSQWAQFVYGTYTVVGGNADLETSNTYVKATGNLEISKIVTRTDSQTPSGENFQFNIKMTASNDTAVTGTYSYELYSGTYDADQKTWSWTLDDPEVGAAANEITFGENGITGVTGQAEPGDGAGNCIELDHAQKIVIKGLPSGATAQITETETSRAGYSPVWSGDTATQTPGATTTTQAISANDPVEVTCTNTTGAVLPSTGGMGTTPFLALGTLLTLGAGMLLVQRRRKEGSDAV